MSLKKMALRIVMIFGMIIVGSGLPGAAELQPGAKQSVRGGGVTVAVTPLSGTDDVPTFSVTLDTHSVNLEVYDFEQIVRLLDERGGELAPTAVEGTEGGGHHRKATVRFVWPRPRPKSLEVVVKDVAGVPERVFRWTIE